MLIVISLTLSGYKEQLNNNLKYDSELTGAVNDAITAFELNSASQDYSNVSDNFTSIVEASVNIFRRSLATRLNMTNADQSLMNRYFPLALFTGYSGYYIYSPTYAPIVVKNPNTGQGAFSSDAIPDNQLDKNSGTYDTPLPDHMSLQYTPILLRHKNHTGTSSPVNVTTNKDLNTSNQTAAEEINYSLKQMIPYAVEFKVDDNNKILLNFTLDNYISFSGKINGIPYNKSGYLLNHNTKIKLEQGSEILYNVENMSKDLSISHLTYFDEYVDDYIENVLAKSEKNLTLTVEENGKVASIVFYPDGYNNALEEYLKSDRQQTIGRFAHQRQQIDAIKYYIKAANFSNFVYKNLGGYSEKDIVSTINIDDDYKKYFVQYNSSNSKPIFYKYENILDYNSNFNEIKRKVIKNSIQYDLIVATENYNYLVSSEDYILRLPEITENDWDRIIENISFTAFLQGFNIGGGKKYNSYAVATSTINEFVINPDTIYFTTINSFNVADNPLYSLEDSTYNLYYHKILCNDFLEYLKSKDSTGEGEDSCAIGFKIGEWLYDARWSREESQYIYNHKNYSHFNCITSYNTKLYNDLNDIEKKIVNKNIFAAVAAEKERSFKSNKIIDGGGYQISDTSLVEGNIKAIEVAIKNSSIEKRTYTFNVKGELFDVTNYGSIASYPADSSSYGSSKYSEYRDFIKNLLDFPGLPGLKWKDINNIEVTVSTGEEIKYIKVLYF